MEADDSGLPERAQILGCPIDRVDMDAAVDACARFLGRGEPAQHVAINAAKLVALNGDPAIAEMIKACELITADGQAVVWASRLLGDPLPERVAGIDLMYRLFALAEEHGYGIYILGARQQVLVKGVHRLREMHPKLQLSGFRNGYFQEAEAAEVADQIRRSGAHILLVAISSPRKEEFLDAYRHAMGLPLVMGVGGSIDVLAGLTRRAPARMQRLGLEWLFRLAQEPGRLLKRYASTNVRFIWLVAREVLSRRLLPKLKAGASITRGS